jgi:hypothetical protein
MQYGVLALTPLTESRSLCTITGIGEIQVTSGISSILNQLYKTPLILKILDWSEISDDTKDNDFSPICHIPQYSAPDDFHYVVVVGSGIEGGNIYFDCMSSYGLAGDHGYFKIYATFNGETTLKKWCVEILYPVGVSLYQPQSNTIDNRI